MVTKTTILIDGGFYSKRSNTLWGEKSPETRAKNSEHIAMNIWKEKMGKLQGNYIGYSIMIALQFLKSLPSTSW